MQQYAMSVSVRMVLSGERTPVYYSLTCLDITASGWRDERDGYLCAVWEVFLSVRTGGKCFER